jgi:hypothetical protein
MLNNIGIENEEPSLLNGLREAKAIQETGEKRHGPKAVFVGGGAHRLIPILRAALFESNIFEGDEIYLHDLNVIRVEAVGRILQKTPEYQHRNVRIRWGSSWMRRFPVPTLST